MSKRLSSMIFAAGLLATSAAQALTWTLNGVTFDDNTTVTGSFNFDAVTGDYSNWSLNVQAGSFLGAYTYTDGGNGNFLGVHDALSADFVAFPSGPSRYLRLTFLNALSDLGGVVSLGPAGYECNNCSQLRNIVSGNVSALAVPEPSVWALYGLGLASLAGIGRRRKGASVTH